MLSYGKKIGRSHININIGMIRKPLLSEIDELGFDVFDFYEGLLVLTPSLYAKKQLELELISQEDADKMSSRKLYDIIRTDEMLERQYTDMLDFFFEEKVVYHDGLFYILSGNNMAGAYVEGAGNQVVAKGYISDDNLQTVLSIIAETCYIKKEDSEEEVRFKNEEARRLYEKMKKARENNELKKRADINYTLPNIISSVANKHPSLNYTNIYELTVYQLMDCFDRLQLNTLYDISSTTVAVWGDEKRTFDASLWYKNNNENEKKT